MDNLTPLTPQQAAVIGAYTGYLVGDFADVHGYIEHLLGRPVWTHELGSEEMSATIRDAARADFLALVPTEAKVAKR